ncbi:MAG: hypothetical protein HUK02_04515 [Bacteroidaceae bacterium]|nr:hypothetical protein [Bacteroidaceae bacterium]
MITEIVIKQAIEPIHITINLNDVIHSLKNDWAKFRTMDIPNKLLYLFGGCMQQGRTSSQYNAVQFEVVRDSVLVRIANHKPRKRNLVKHVEGMDTLCIYDFRFNQSADGIQPMSTVPTSKGNIPLETIFINERHLSCYNETITILRSFISFFMKGGVYHHPYGTISEGQLKLPISTKKRIRLTEGQLHNLIKGCLHRILK